MSDNFVNLLNGSIFVPACIPAIACNFSTGMCVLELKTRTRLS